MAEKTDDKLKLILELQDKNIDIEEIANKLQFPSVQALRSFMNRNGFKSHKGIFVKKENTNTVNNETNIADKETPIKTIQNKEENKKEKKEENKKEKKERDEDKTLAPNPNVEKVLDLQIYNVPLLKIGKMIDMKDYEIDKMMEEHGYVRTGERFVSKPKPTKIKKTEKKKKVTANKNKKEKTQKQLLEEEYKKNPAKRGVFDPINQVWVINVQLVEILDLQLQKLNIGQIAKQMKMTKPALIEFMEEKGYVLENDKFVQRKLAKKNISNDIEPVKELKPRVYDDRKELVEFTSDDFNDLLIDIQNMFNWYTNIKEHHLFETLKTSDMEK